MTKTTDCPETKPRNPIAFNPDTMTVSQLKECADTLRSLFSYIERADADDVVFSIEQARDSMLRRWEKK